MPNLLQERSKSTLVKSPANPAVKTPVNPAKNSIHFWNKIPQWVNRFIYLLKSTPSSHDDYLDYDPFCLRVFTNQRYNAFGDQFYVKTLKQDKQLFERLNQKEMDLETFKLAVEQIPAVKNIEFSGRGEPLLNPDLFAMIHHAYQFNGAESLVVTNGHLLKKHAQAMLNSPLNKLCIQLFGHKPSLYHQMSGLDAHNFVPIVENIKYFLQLKKAQHIGIQTMISMTVDVHTFRNIPEMIVFAYELGADGIVINNFLSDDPNESSERSLYTDHEVVLQFLEAISGKLDQFQNFEVTLPTLLERDMSKNRFCQEAYTTVAVDGSCTVYPCSRQLLQDELGDAPKIWEPNFWNHQTYHQLRNIHSRNQNQATPVPNACQHCPRNLSCSQ